MSLVMAAQQMGDLPILELVTVLHRPGQLFQRRVDGISASGVAVAVAVEGGQLTIRFAQRHCTAEATRCQRGLQRQATSVAFFGPERVPVH